MPNGLNVKRTFTKRLSMITSNSELVRTWMQRADQLTNPDNEQREQQLAYVEEEFYELLYAYRNESRGQVIKEACDLLWVTYGLLLTLGVDPDSAFDRLYTSNWSKFPFTKVDGKVQKGPNYKPVDFSDL
jgi:phosphoribosyl-ATP pyrophosphohydrolase